MRAVVCLTALMLTVATGAQAQSSYTDETTPEGWAWAQIRNDRIADFNIHCGTSALDPHAKTGWDDPCRQVSAKFIEDILIVAKLRDQVLRRRVRLRGAHISGPLNLSDAEITAEVWLDASRIDGDVYLADSRWSRSLSFDGTMVTGRLDAERLRSESDVYLKHAMFGQEVNLLGAKIDGALGMDGSSFATIVELNRLIVGGALFMRDHATFGGDVDLAAAKVGSNLEMSSSSFAAAVDANSLNVGGDLLMRDHATFGSEVNLVGAKVGGNLEMETSSFAAAVDADGLTVGGALLMRDHATFAGEVNLVGAKISSNLEMDTASFAATVDADGLTVGGYLFMRDHATFGSEVNLLGAKVGSNLEMDNSSFSDTVTAESLAVERNLFMRGATFGGTVELFGAKISGGLDLGSSTATNIDLSNAETGEFRFGGLKWRCSNDKAPAPADTATAAPGGKSPPLRWPLGNSDWRTARCDGADAPKLTLRNAHVSSLQDSPDAWPPALDLEGFRYDRLGGFGGVGRDDMRQRTPAEWQDWLERDPAFSTQPYSELGSVLAAAGRRDTADAIEFAGRERERGEACASWSRAGSCAWLTFLSYVAGYGIGLYTFLVLLWVLGLAGFGADVLWYSPNARQHGYSWRLGASLHRLLPVIELSKEFTDFFDNPPPKPGDPPNLSRFQTAYFAGHAIAGWVLGFFLLAAMGGITQKG
jgi:hypothetical protein